MSLAGPSPNIWTATSDAIEVLIPGFVFIDGLPTIAISEIQDPDEECSLCGIVHDLPDVTELPVCLPCGHIYHSACVQDLQSHRLTNPMDRSLRSELSSENLLLDHPRNNEDTLKFSDIYPQLHAHDRLPAKHKSYEDPQMLTAKKEVQLPQLLAQRPGKFRRSRRRAKRQPEEWSGWVRATEGW